ncbi:MAG TPA: hypothetical protein PK620_07975 [Denitromonas sp.]|uniref:hypothetical protein n=1 Tax=Denitromonas sp. TaxID=2734609 RepID=UPI001DEA3C04|nr:hypothetical protein [Rhodocyclaceae bacterium]MCP5222874.1 hypothetical protein [Zoogloeaceae bacterium]HPR06682.1 hypothetical protein [Denitromonas sp.]HQU88504.1 hypothetical protein [Denitromonas sp.]HQV14839.1 hypothetical protein [Denitromonas sp.]
MPTARPLHAIAVLAIAGCSSVPGPGEGPSTQWLLAPAAAITVIESGYTTNPQIAGMVAAWALIDPLAPNWQIQATRVDERNVRFRLQHKLLHTGGEGEARQVLRRNAERITAQEGFSEYEIVRFEEGIDSTRPFARRTAIADVRMLRGRALPGL